MKHFLIKFFCCIFMLAQTIVILTKSEDYCFYIKVDSGVSSAQSADITAVFPPWDQALQGYNGSLGHAGIAGFSVGYELFHILDLEVGVSNRSIFNYQQYQIPVDTDNLSYTREFNLTVTPILFSANILGRGIDHLHIDFDCGKLYPMFGAGVGVSNLLITNFRTTGLPANGDSYPYSTFSAENEYTLRQNFTYAVLAGFEYSHGDRWAVSTGYRWLNAGKFDGPQYVRSSNGSAVDLASDQWQMRFQTNEWFLEFKIFI
ncbi:MAG: hypothetical protein ACXWL2_03075 [Candidatus Chromulinivorax sp.]